MIRLTSAAALVGLGLLPAPATTHVVRLDRNSFIPAETQAAPGDTVRFVNGDGGPHNVAFVADSIAKDARAAIGAAMPKPKITDLSSSMLILRDESYTIVVPKLEAGRYAFMCQPHYASMRGAIVVTR